MALRRLFLDEHSWRSVAYLALHSLWGFITGWLTVLVLAQTLLLLVVPVLIGRSPERGFEIYGLVDVQGFTALAIATGMPMTSAMKIAASAS